MGPIFAAFVDARKIFSMLIVTARQSARSDGDEITDMTCPRLPLRQPYAIVNAECEVFVCIQSDVCYREHPMKSPRSPNRGLYPFDWQKHKIALIDRAAGTLRQSRAFFVRTVAKQAAEEVLHAGSHLSMSPKGFGAFMRAVSAPAAKMPEMMASLWPQSTLGQRSHRIVTRPQRARRGPGKIAKAGARRPILDTVAGAHGAATVPSSSRIGSVWLGQRDQRAMHLHHGQGIPLAIGQQRLAKLRDIRRIGDRARRHLREGR